MKLKQIEEIATKPVPVWQPVLLTLLLLLGYFAIPLIAKKNIPVSNTQKNQSIVTTLGIDTMKERLGSDMESAVKPLSNQLKKEAGSVLGLAQQTVKQTVQDIASRSADQAKEFVFDNTFGKVLQNINSLPSDQQDLIKKAICK